MNVERNNEEKTVRIQFPTINGIGTLTLQKTKNKKFKYSLIIGTERKDFKNDKPIWNMGDTNHCKLFKTLNSAFKKMNNSPNFQKDGLLENLKEFALEMSGDEEGIEEIFDDFAEQEAQDEEKRKEEKQNEISEEEKPSYFEEKGYTDKDLTSKHFSSARKKIEEGTFLEYCLNVLEGVVISQRPKACVTLLIALSSLWGDPIHGMMVAGPDSSKSWIAGHVFDIFPMRRKFKLGVGTSAATLSRYTQFKEGAHVLDHKFVLMGDIGNEEEIKNKGLQEVFTVLKNLMSEHEYVKDVSDTSNDNKTLINLTLKGIGSIILETVNTGVEKQFDSRTFRYSPDSSKKISDDIWDYECDPIRNKESKIIFDADKLYCRAGIELLYKEISNIESDGTKLDVYNPFYKIMTSDIFEARGGKRRIRKSIGKLAEAVAITNLFTHDIYCKTLKGVKTSYIILKPEEFRYCMKMTGKSIGYSLSKKLPEDAISYITLIEGSYMPLFERDYTKAEIEEGMDDDDEEIKKWVLKHKKVAIKAPQIAGDMGVTPKTAYSYLNRLEGLGLLYRIQFSQFDTRYYPTSDWEEKLKNAGVKYPSKNDLKKDSETMKKVYNEYNDFIARLDECGYVLKTSRNATGNAL